MHGLLIEPEISGEMGYIGLSVGIYGDGNAVYHSAVNQTVYIGTFIDMTPSITIKQTDQGGS